MDEDSSNENDVETRAVAQVRNELAAQDTVTRYEIVSVRDSIVEVIVEREETQTPILYRVELRPGFQGDDERLHWSYLGETVEESS